MGRQDYNLEKLHRRLAADGVTDIRSVLITPDGKNYLYEYGRTLSDLYLVNDLK